MSEVPVLQSLMRSIESVGEAVGIHSKAIGIMTNRLRELNERVSKLEIEVALMNAREKDNKKPPPLV